MMHRLHLPRKGYFNITIIIYLPTESLSAFFEISSAIVGVSASMSGVKLRDTPKIWFPPAVYLALLDQRLSDCTVYQITLL